MGLDITAYSGLSAVENPERDADGYPVSDDHIWLKRADVSEKDFPGRAQGVDPKLIYEFADSMRFRGGNYSGYNQWRDWLARVAGYESAAAVWDNPPPEGSPFVELINFSDCEGVIGPVVSAKLAKDFAQFRDAAKADDDANISPLYFEQYCKWQQAFELAADNGAVDFH